MYLIVKKSKGDDDKEDPIDNNKADSSTADGTADSDQRAGNDVGTFVSEKVNPGNCQSSLKMFLDVDDAAEGYGYEKKALDLSDVMVKVGISLHFK